MESFYKALDIQKEILGEKHIDVAIIYNNIGDVHSSQGNYEKALEFYNIALDMQKEILGEKHVDNAASYINMSVAYNSQ